MMAEDILKALREKFPEQLIDGNLFPLCDEYGCQSRFHEALEELEKRLAQKR